MIASALRHIPPGDAPWPSTAAGRRSSRCAGSGKNTQDGLFPVWRYHAFFTDTILSTVDADVTHRQHAVIETVFADLIDGPLAHLPSGRFAANAAWAICAGMAHNLLRAAGCLAGRLHAKARGATLRRQLVCVPARLAAPRAGPPSTCPPTS
jgi:hypothetical protein